MRKRFDAVRFQRRIREELSREYLKDRDAFLKELKRYRTTKKARQTIDSRP